MFLLGSYLFFSGRRWDWWGWFARTPQKIKTYWFFKSKFRFYTARLQFMVWWYCI